MNIQETSQELSSNNHRIIISLTCISYRISHILPVINSLLSQTMKPDIIILWLSKDEYLNDKGVPYNKIPRDIRKLSDTSEVNFDIRYTENIGPFRKLLPALEQYNCLGDIIVTADDDIIYPEYWLEYLYKEYLKNNCITCFRAKVIQFNGDNTLQPYFKWPVLDHLDNRKDLFLCPTGNNGILYSPEFFDDRIFDPIYRKICSSRCDIWFSASAIANQVLTKQISARPVDDDKLIIENSRFSALTPSFFLQRFRNIRWPELCGLNHSLNDKMINAVFKYYSIC